MSDDLADLGTNNTIFEFDADWTTEPSETLEPFVTADIYPGTIHSVYFHDEPPRKINFKISDYQTNLYPFLIFLADRVGRLKSFWLPDLFQRFTPVSIASDWLSIQVEKLANLHLHGHERLFLRMANDDKVTRKIMSITQLTSTTQINFGTPISAINVEDIEHASFIYLGRFDQDEFDISYSGRIPSVQFSFMEMLQEYDTWA